MEHVQQGLEHCSDVWVLLAVGPDKPLAKHRITIRRILLQYLRMQCMHQLPAPNGHSTA